MQQVPQQQQQQQELQQPVAWQNIEGRAWYGVVERRLSAVHEHNKMLETRLLDLEAQVAGIPELVRTLVQEAVREAQVAELHTLVQEAVRDALQQHAPPADAAAEQLHAHQWPPPPVPQLPAMQQPQPQHPGGPQPSRTGSPPVQQLPPQLPPQQQQVPLSLEDGCCTHTLEHPNGFAWPNKSKLDYFQEADALVTMRNVDAKEQSLRDTLFLFSKYSWGEGILAALREAVTKGTGVLYSYRTKKYAMLCFQCSGCHATLFKEYKLASSNDLASLQESLGFYFNIPRPPADEMVET